MAVADNTFVAFRLIDYFAAVQRVFFISKGKSISEKEKMARETFAFSERRLVPDNTIDFKF